MLNCDDSTSVISTMRNLPNTEKYVKGTYMVPYLTPTFYVSTEKESFIIQTRKGLSKHCLFDVSRVGDNCFAENLLFSEMLAILSGSDISTLKQVNKTSLYAEASNAVEVMKKLKEIRDYWKLSDIAYTVLTEDLKCLYMDVVPVKDKFGVEEPLFIVTERISVSRVETKIFTAFSLATHAKSL